MYYCRITTEILTVHGTLYERPETEPQRQKFGIKLVPALTAQDHIKNTINYRKEINIYDKVQNSKRLAVANDLVIDATQNTYEEKRKENTFCKRRIPSSTYAAQETRHLMRGKNVRDSFLLSSN